MKVKKVKKIKRVEKSAAIVTIFNASEMHGSGKRKIAAWLRRQARLLEKHADQLSKRYTARYLYLDD